MEKLSGLSGRKLVVVSLEYLPPHASGNGVYAEQLFRALKENWEVKVVSAYRGGDLPSHVIPVPLGEGGAEENRFEFALKSLETLEGFQGYTPDLVLAIDWCSAPLAMVLSKKAGCPLLWMPFRVFSYSGDSQLSEEMEKLISKNATAILTVSRGDAILVEKFFSRKAIPLYPPITIGGGASPRREKFILAVSRVAREKNLEALIKALPLIPEEFSLRVAGGFSDTKYLDKLKTLAESLEVSGRVTFLGRVSPARLNELYATARIYVSTAKYEPFGLSIMEAAYHRLPVVMDSSNFVGAGELLIHGRSCLKVAVNSREELAGAVRKLISNQKKAEKMGEEGKRAAERLTFTAFKDKINNFILSIVDRGEHGVERR
jgi:glycosyltransferase involved in cell wall biosynthesis